MPGGRDERRDRDEAAFAGVVDAYQGRLLRYVARLLGSPSQAEDVVQRTFIKCATSWKRPMEPSDDLSAWLHRVAHNEAVDHARRERRIGLLHSRHAEEREAETGNAVPAQSQAPESAGPEVVEALRRLGDRERLLVTLKVYEEKSYREIADITGMSTSNVGVTLHNAMRKLAGFLAPLLGKDRT